MDRDIAPGHSQMQYILGGDQIDRTSSTGLSRSERWPSSTRLARAAGSSLVESLVRVRSAEFLP
jgi:hypothetical protein